jgi:hypothetical protein
VGGVFIYFSEDPDPFPVAARGVLTLQFLLEALRLKSTQGSTPLQ